MNSPLSLMSAKISSHCCGFVSYANPTDTNNCSAYLTNTADTYDEEFAAQIEAYEAWQAAILLD
jgi:hypothetical protein